MPPTTAGRMPAATWWHPGAERGGAGGWQGCSEAQGAAKSSRGLPQSKALRVFGGVEGRDGVLARACPLALWHDCARGRWRAGLSCGLACVGGHPGVNNQRELQRHSHEWGGGAAV